MKKEAYYFSHDSNAQNDEKIIKLRIDYGWEGYGIFWALIEILREASNYEIECDCNAIAFRLQCDIKKLENIIKNYNLFEIDNNKIYSQSLKQRMILKSKNARQSAEARWNKKGEEDANAMRLECERNAIGMRNDAIKVKESKVKESKVKEIKENNIIINNNIKKEYLSFYNKTENKKEYAEFVYMTENEADRLINEFGRLYFDKAIDYLSLWKQEKLNLGDKKTCKGDDNLKIRKWVISKVMEDFKKQDYEAYRQYEETRKKATNPEVVLIIKDLLESGYAKDKKMLLETDFEKLKLWHYDLQIRREKGEYQ